MTVSIARRCPLPRDDAAGPPIPCRRRATIEETGLHPDTLSQLLLKTLVAGEASGTSLSERLRVPYSVLDALIQHARVEKLLEVRGTSGTGAAGYRYVLTDLGRDRAGQFLDMSAGTSVRLLCRSAQYNDYVRACMAARPYVDRKTAVRPASSSSSSATAARSARSGREFGQVAVPVRCARQRQDGRSRGHRASTRRRDAHAVRDGRGRPDHHDVRPGQPPAPRRRRPGTQSVVPRRSRIADGSESAARSSWSAAS